MREIWVRKLKQKINYHRRSAVVAARFERKETVDWHTLWIKATEKELKEYLNDQANQRDGSV
jgi:hypothetical protein